MKLPDVRDLSVRNKTVLLRTDYDVPLVRAGSGERGEGRWEVADTSRIDESIPTINYLLKQGAKVVILSHLGRPEVKIVPELSLKPVAEYLNSNLKSKISNLQLKTQNFDSLQISDNLILLENIRFFPGEETNDPEFAKQLASLGDFYINDAFAVSHRSHASIVGLPSLLPSAFGFDMLEEINTLTPVREKPRRPVVVILGGAKEDKLRYIQLLTDFADQILVGGRLPFLLLNTESRIPPTLKLRRAGKNYEKNKGLAHDSLFMIHNSKVVIATLNESGKDITLESVNLFKEIIAKAGTVIWAGPMGKYEESGEEQGTKVIGEAVVSSGAYTILGGGDTEAALTQLELVNKINYICSGGGAMLEFLSTGTLVGIESIVNSNR